MADAAVGEPAAMEFKPWEVPISADWHRSTTLLDLDYAGDTLALIIREEETNLKWRLQFEDVCGVKILTGDSAQWNVEPLPAEGGFFIVTGSPWLGALGLTDNAIHAPWRQYVVCCRNEIIEVIASDCDIADLAE